MTTTIDVGPTAVRIVGMKDVRKGEGKHNPKTK